MSKSRERGTANEMAQHPLFKDIELGIGTWAWGDQLFWGYGRTYRKEDVLQAFKACVEGGITFFDTAEVYGTGRSERILGELARNIEAPLLIGTKFMPFPWRLTRGSLKRALQGSLKRLGMEKVSLYQTHFHLPPVGVEVWMEAMAEVHQEGLIEAVGVSNYDRRQMRLAYDTLRREGIALASNQVEYHLLNRKVEKSGLLKDCMENGVALIAYSPLAQGVLSGKYSVASPPPGFRAGKYNRSLLKRIQPLIMVMKKIGADHGGMNASQVALNWVIAKGAIPIPGVKNFAQAEQNLGTLGWRLTEAEVALLDDLSDRIAAGQEIS